MAILKNDDDVCDALQDTLLSAYQNLGSLQNKDYFATWIIRILVNKCYDIIRKNKKVVYLNQKLEIQEDTYYQMYSQESDLERILNQIDSDLKTVTVLYYYDDLSISTISEILNIPEGTVKSRLSRAREKIFKILKKEEGEFNG
jgi:RNA polymerase sigma-70 factor (ECF subfamily)